MADGRVLVPISISDTQVETGLDRPGALGHLRVLHVAGLAFDEATAATLRASESIADLVASHPRLSEAEVRGALAFAAAALRADVTYPVAS